MWLLELHLAISILCLLTFIGFYILMKDKIRQNGYPVCMSGMLRSLWYLFIPIINLITIITLFVMAAISKDEVYKWYEERKARKNK